jgi:hypothetical protein
MKLIDRIRQIRVTASNIRKSLINIYILKKKRPQIPVYTYKGLIKSIEKRGDICHIIASGYSALSSYNNNIIKSNEYIIGMNFSAFLPYKFDFYFCEPGPNEIIEKLFLLLERCNTRISRLVFKNIYYSNDLSNISSEIKYSIVLDKQLIFNTDTVKKLVRRPALLMPQFSSTVITATMLAYHIGFKNIIIHGLDFSGPHLYHDESLQKQIGIEAPTPYVSKEKVHLTAAGQELVWPGLIQFFAKKDINIFCASNESNFKKYVKVWDDEVSAINHSPSPPPPNHEENRQWVVVEYVHYRVVYFGTKESSWLAAA